MIYFFLLLKNISPDKEGLKNHLPSAELFCFLKVERK